MPRAPPSSSPPVPPPPPFRDAIRDPLMRRSRVTRLLFLPISIPAEASVPPIASKVRGELCLAVRQASRGTNRSHSPRGTIEAATFELPDPVGNSGTRAATLTVERVGTTVERSKRRRFRYERESARRSRASEKLPPTALIRPAASAN